MSKSFDEEEIVRRRIAALMAMSVTPLVELALQDQGIFGP